MSVDLHIHTSASDGTTPPSKLIEEANQAGLSCISLTDHESIEGIIEIQGLAQAKNIKLIPGVELLAGYADREIHLLGYYIDINSPILNNRLKELREERNAIAMDIVEKLRRHGFNINFERVQGIAQDNVAIGKNHILHAIYEAGYINSQDEMIEILRKYLTRNGLAYVEFTQHSFGEAVELILQCDGIPVLAHPGLIRDDQIVLELLKYPVEGIEVYYYYFGNKRDEWIRRYEQLAQERKLLMTGGSDYHGQFAPVKLGEMHIPERVVTTLTEHWMARHQQSTVKHNVAR
ncbi:MAG: PHP domain-containing protein [Firmicutes bacterium]|nr:PHP domain-containing protein [Bacillota bacterium]